MLWFPLQFTQWTPYVISRSGLEALFGKVALVASKKLGLCGSLFGAPGVCLESPSDPNQKWNNDQPLFWVTNNFLRVRRRLQVVTFWEDHAKQKAWTLWVTFWGRLESWWPPANRPVPFCFLVAFRWCFGIVSDFHSPKVNSLSGQLASKLLGLCGGQSSQWK